MVWRRNTMGNEMSLLDPGTLLYGLGSFVAFVLLLVAGARHLDALAAAESAESAETEGDED
jgi:hypothetical protein